ncbi:MAG: hypothetical protein IPQ07_38175 [Myxococcales bacterium]|nr:hypothetical protein [Myxococcales bacterium]
MQKISTVLLVLLMGCSVESPPESTSTEAVARKNKTVTSIIVNGRSAYAALLDDQGTNGFLAATRDQVANTSGLDFSWATPDPTNPDLAILYQGAGEIPNAAFTQNGTTATLNLTTPADYPINRCVINMNDGTFTCAASGPLTFNVSWVQNGFGSVHETTKRVETLGPVTTKVKAEFTTVTATVNGTWGGRSSPDLGGDLTDSESKTSIREITVAF